jgi:hypothetical protein
METGNAGLYYAAVQMNYSISEVVQALRETFQSLDIRVAATRQNGEWMVQMAVVRLSYEPVVASMKSV